MDQRNSLQERSVLWAIEAQQPDFACDANAQARLRRWLEESQAHAAAFIKAQHTLNRMDSVLTHSAIDRSSLLHIYRASERSYQRRNPARRWLSAAAAMTVGLCLPLLPKPLDAAPTFFGTRLGEQRTITLSEGVQITLGADTAILVRGDGRFREIDILRGETFLTLPDHLPRPLRIFSPLGMVAGTARAFEVRQSTGAFRVAAVQGTLSVLPIDSLHEVLSPDSLEPGKATDSNHTPLHTGDVATLRNAYSATRIAVENREPDEIDQLLAWRDGTLAFSNEPAWTVVESFNRYNRQQLVIVDEDIAELRLSGNFRSDDPDSFALALGHLYPDFKIVAERDAGNGAILLRRQTSAPGRRVP